MRRNLCLFLAVVAASALAPGAAAAATAPSWAQRQITTVVERGLMGPSVAGFRPNAALTREELGQALAIFTGLPQVVADPQRAVTVAELDAKLVEAVGLAPAAAEIGRKVTAAGLQPPARLGRETVARYLGLRFNHPYRYDGRELRPADPATRAEAAYSLAQLLKVSQWKIDQVNQLALSLALPTYTAWQDRVLTRAVRFVGFPYIWGGTSERPQTLFGVSSRGGFDCSGFVWRVYKRPFLNGGRLAYVIRGRTTYQMSGEVPRSRRISLAKLRPGDVVFFGNRGPSSSPSEVGHTGIYLGAGWLVHSSGQGVTMLPLAGWYADTFAWARRPLREAGLT